MRVIAIIRTGFEGCEFWAKITTTLAADDHFAAQNFLRGTPEEPSLAPPAPLLFLLKELFRNVEIIKV